MATFRAVADSALAKLTPAPAQQRACSAFLTRRVACSKAFFSGPLQIGAEHIPVTAGHRQTKMGGGRAGSARAATASSAEPKAAEQRSGPDAPPGWFQFRHLEGNSWLWNMGGVQLAVDPVLVGNLDFGIPWLYNAAKRTVGDFSIDDLPELDCLLLTQSLDDHCHMNTLRPLAQKLPDLRVVATLNAQPKLEGLFRNVTYLAPGDRCTLEGKNGVKLEVRATQGPVLGPPWQRPENGYVVSPLEGEPGLSVYYEPHCMTKEKLEELAPVDCVVTPVTKQVLPAYTLVSGQEDAVELCRRLQARYVVPFNNGDLAANGLLSLVVKTIGTIDSFQAMASRDLPSLKVVDNTPGKDISVPS